MRHRPSLLLLLPLLGALSVPAELAAKTAPTKPSQTQTQLNQSQAELDQLKQQLGNLQQQISATESSRQDVSDALKESEQAISDANRTLSELNDEQDGLEDRLKQLDQQARKLDKQVAAQKASLAAKLRAQYRDGNSDTLRLLLNSEDPNTTSRDLAYLRYIAAAHQQEIAALKNNLATLAATRDDIARKHQRLDEIQGNRRREKERLLTQQASHKEQLAQLNSQLAAQRQQVGKIQRDEQRLAGLVDQLTRVLAEQERQRQARLKAEAEARAKAEKAEKQRQARIAQQQQQQKKTPPTRQAEAQTTPPKETPSRETPTNRVTLSAPSAQVSGDAQSLKGKLLSPIASSPANRFGQPRADSGVAWRGWFYPAQEGADIKAVAAGQVVYADWLRGFGNLVIVDHGGGLMSIYGSTESVLKHVGDPVAAGERIARAGNSGGSDKSGLYFELRYKGKAFDPAGWLRG